MSFKKILFSFLFITIAFSSIADDKKLNSDDTELSFYSGIFDFSDDGKNQLWLVLNIKMKT